MFSLKLKPITLAVISAISLTSAAYAADVIKAEKVEVISQTPLPGIGIEKDKLPSTVQTVKASDIEKSQSLDLSDYMNKNMAGVFVNEVQGNPLQPNINYHGFVASPLLGTPQGMSVYMDGVRMNQPFGDVVSWDLIPKNAIQNMQLYSGSNPMFGLNTLGGAVSIQTKNGRNNPGGSIQLTTGSWGRKIGEFEYGGVSKDNSVDYFVAGTWFDEEGWRDHSPSDNKQLFTKLGWQGENTNLHLTYAYSESDLNGNGVVPQSILASGYNKVYTYPDNTQNKSHFVNLDWSHYFSDKAVLTGNAYYRNIKSHSLNGDINGGAFPSIDSSSLPASFQVLGQTSGIALGSTSYDYAGALNNCNSAIGSHSEAGEACNGLINRTSTQQENYGIFSQISIANEFFNRPNNYVVGAGFDRSTTHFISSSELGVLSDQTVIGTGHFENASEGFNSNGAPLDNAVNLKGTTNTWSVYGSDTLDLTDKLSLTAAARYNHTKISNKDQLTHYTYNMNPDDQTLTGDHQYNRINPSIGLSYSPYSGFNVYGNYNEGSRAPTSIELGCSDPEHACKLPNAMASDPHLNQVVSKTWEAGVRTKPTSNTALNLSFYTTTNENDIMFVSTTTNGDGYFKNFGQTRRDGVDASFTGSFGKLTLAGNYSFIDATYQSEDTFSSAANNSGVVICSADAKLASTSHTCLATNSTSNIGVSSGLAPTLSNGIYMASNGDQLTAISGQTGAYQDQSGNAYYLVGSSWFSPTTASNQSYVTGTTTGSMKYNNNNDYTTLITVKKNDRIPLIPRNVLKLYANYDLTDKFAIGASTITTSGRILQGNENNQDSRGRIGGFTTLDLAATFKFDSDWLIFAKVNNVFDRQYATSGSLGMNALDANGNPRFGSIVSNGTNYYRAVSEAFVAPGAPRAAWIGVRYEFGGKKSSSVDKD
jgi:outer membrane receptor protein involved in Fe transport